MSDQQIRLESDMDVVPGTTYRRILGQRDQWMRAFNKLDAAINHHERDSPAEFRSDADDRLHLARTKIHMHLHEGTI